LPEHDDFILWRLSEFISAWGFGETKAWLERVSGRGFENLLVIVTPTDVASEFDLPAGSPRVSAEQLNQLVAAGARICVASGSGKSPPDLDEFGRLLLAQLNPPDLTADIVVPPPASGTGSRQGDLDALLRDLRKLGSYAT
jgi:hypothetical protein